MDTTSERIPVRTLKRPPDRIADLSDGAAAYTHKGLKAAMNLVQAPMAAAAEAALRKVTDACTRWDKEGSGRVTLNAYLLALRSAGMQDGGREKERAQELAQAGGNAVRLPPAWLVGDACGGKRDGHFEAHGSVHYGAVDRRVRSAWSKVLGTELGEASGRASRFIHMDDVAWKIALAQIEAERTALALSDKVCEPPARTSGGQGAHGSTTAARAHEGGSEALVEALLKENATLRDVHEREKGRKRHGPLPFAEEMGIVSRRLLDLQLESALQRQRHADARHAELDSRELALREKELECAEREAKLLEAQKDVEARDSFLREKEKRWEKEHPGEVELVRVMQQMKEKLIEVEAAAGEKDDVNALREEVRAARRERDAAVQRGDLLAAMSREYSDATQTAATLRRALEVVNHERSVYYRSLSAIEAVCEELPDQCAAKVRMCMPA